MTEIAQDRLVAKEEALGAIREIEPPQSHIGLRLFAPLLDVQSDDVIFSYVAPDSVGLAPARAEDAESELAEKDDTVGTGRASTIDWAIKDHYDPSDVSRYREYLRIAELVAGGGSFPLTIGSMTEDFATKLAKEQARRRRKLDNRLEWLIMTALDLGVISYSDGKIAFTVPYGRPDNQQAQAPTAAWTSANHATADPIGDAIEVDQFMYDTHGVRMGSVIMSRKAILGMTYSDRWVARSGLAQTAGGGPVDPRYVIDGWGLDAVKSIYERQTGLKVIEYDSVYRTRAMGSKTTVNHRFTTEERIIYLPKDEYIEEVSDTEIGFGRTLTSPHPEGNWTPGFYEWEKSDVDPWGLDRGTGIKAFPVFPHMEFTFTQDVL